MQIRLGAEGPICEDAAGLHSLLSALHWSSGSCTDGNGYSFVYHSVVTGVPSYGRKITKAECANHAVKCYRNRLEALCNDKPDYRGKHGLSQAMMKRITHGARCAVKMHSTTGDVAALRHDIQNGPRHCFGFHDNCSSTFFQCQPNTSSGNVKIIMRFHC